MSRNGGEETAVLIRSWERKYAGGHLGRRNRDWRAGGGTKRPIIQGGEGKGGHTKGVETNWRR